MLVCEDVAVDEFLQFVDVCSRSHEGVNGRIFPMSEYTEKQVVGSDSIASGPHRFLSGIVDYRVQLV